MVWISQDSDEDAVSELRSQTMYSETKLRVRTDKDVVDPLEGVGGALYCSESTLLLRRDNTKK